MKTHIIQNMITQDDKGASSILIPVEPEPYLEDGRWIIYSEGFKLSLIDDEALKEQLLELSPFSPNDLLVEPEEWAIDMHQACDYYYLKSGLNKDQWPLLDWQPPSTMPLSLSSKCSKKYKVEQVVGVEFRGVHLSYETGSYKGEVDQRKWHWLIIGEKEKAIL